MMPKYMLRHQLVTAKICGVMDMGLEAGTAHALAAATEADRFGRLRPLREASLGFGCSKGGRLATHMLFYLL